MIFNEEKEVCKRVSLYDRLELTEQKYDELGVRLQESAVVSDPPQFASLMREYKQLTPLVEVYRRYKQCNIDLREGQELLAEAGSDAELHALAEEQYLRAKAEIDALEQQMQIMLLPTDPNDERNVIVEIRSGAGGEEAALFAGSLYRMYSMYAERKGWQRTTLNSNPTELGGMKEVSFSLSGERVYSRMKYESGVHRVQRVPETESQGRVHTSTVTVAVLPEVDAVEVNIQPGDLRIDVFRSSGAGGQHINKTESAVRITHLPTGLVVECQDERSQYKNKDRAMSILNARLFALMEAEQNAKIAGERRSQVGSGDRSERIRTYNFPQGRMTDHRIGLSLFRLDDIMNGDLDTILDALATADQSEKLAKQEAQEL